MLNTQLFNSKGFTLIELMISVAIVGILAAVALQVYPNYTQRTANYACLSEAHSYLITTTTDFAVGGLGTIATPANTAACATSPTPTFAQYAAAENITFIPQSRGASSELKNVLCNAGNAACVLDTN